MGLFFCLTEIDNASLNYFTLTYGTILRNKTERSWIQQYRPPAVTLGIFGDKRASHAACRQPQDPRSPRVILQWTPSRVAALHTNVFGAALDVHGLQIAHNTLEPHKKT